MTAGIPWESWVTLPFADGARELRVSAHKGGVEVENCDDRFLALDVEEGTSIGIHSKAAYEQLMLTLQAAGRELGWDKERQARQGLFGEISPV